MPASAPHNRHGSARLHAQKDMLARQPSERHGRHDFHSTRPAPWPPVEARGECGQICSTFGDRPIEALAKVTEIVFRLHPRSRCHRNSLCRDRHCLGRLALVLAFREVPHHHVEDRGEQEPEQRDAEHAEEHGDADRLAHL